MALPDGYDETVGEEGTLLSVGQKQLISLARTILADPDIIVMDEATSSIDTKTEQDIQTGMETLLEGRTSFVIAHRLSTIRKADRILVIENGVIKEEGSHRELLAQAGTTTSSTPASSERIMHPRCLDSESFCPDSGVPGTGQETRPGQKG